ncbi:WSSV086 [White spot syndrome virus]|uniref:WSSV086 n=1 Tax=White spot syndrome virus TaxID=342409 RepID=A0A2I6SBK7_9VIRU|nr:WSSV086 [White spot syndrome virus]
MSNVPAINTAFGAFEEASSSVRNRLSPLYEDSTKYSSNQLAVQAMTDTAVDALSAVSTVVGRQNGRNTLLSLLLLSIATSGRPSLSYSSDMKSNLIKTISRINRDASLLSMETAK